MIQYFFWSGSKQKIYFLFILLVIIIGGFFYFFFLANDDLAIVTPSIDTPQPQIINTEQVPIKVHHVLGVVEKVSGDEVTVKDVRKILDTAASTEPQEAHMVVSIDGLTLIERLIYKDGATIMKEAEVIYESAQEIQTQNQSVTPPATPDPFTREKITVSDITLGDAISVTATEDIQTPNWFIATEIVVTVMPNPIGLSVDPQ